MCIYVSISAYVYVYAHEDIMRTYVNREIYVHHIYYTCFPSIYIYCPNNVKSVHVRPRQN